MIRSRRLRTRLSILAIVALLWSQFALAAHTPVCGGSTAQAAAASISCHATPAAHDATTCDSHCQNDQRSDTGRVTAPPALPPVPAISLSALNDASSDLGSGGDAPAQQAWNRPTSHPANILLI
jgi:hypothetical protein